MDDGKIVGWTDHLYTFPPRSTEKIKWGKIQEKIEGLLAHCKCSLGTSRNWSYHSATSKSSVSAPGSSPSPLALLLHWHTAHAQLCSHHPWGFSPPQATPCSIHLPTEPGCLPQLPLLSAWLPAQIPSLAPSITSFVKCQWLTWDSGPCTVSPQVLWSHLSFGLLLPFFFLYFETWHIFKKSAPNRCTNYFYKATLVKPLLMVRQIGQVCKSATDFRAFPPQPFPSCLRTNTSLTFAESFSWFLFFFIEV